MKLSSLIFADYAAANEGGKFTLVGAGFNNLNAQKFPYVHPLMFILVRLRITRQDVGKNRVEIKLLGEKGPIFKADCDINVTQDHKQEEHMAFPICLQNIRFDSAGDYDCEVTINGEEPNIHQIHVIEIQTPPAQGLAT